MIRKLDDEFEDGVEKLPGYRLFESVRQESIFTDEAKGSAEFNLPETNNDISTILGQLYTHEIMMTRKAQLESDENKGGFNCCNKDDNPVLQSLIKENKYCLPIDVPNNDAEYKGKVKCLNYIKSVKGLNNCKLDMTAMPVIGFKDCITRIFLMFAAFRLTFTRHTLMLSLFIIHCLCRS